MRPLVAFATLTLAAGACGSTPSENAPMTPPSNHPVFLEVPETDFRLTEEQRASVYPAYSADAVERLLGWTRVEHRAEVLESFQTSTIAALGEKVAVGEPTWTIDHPQLREIAKELRTPTRPPDDAAGQGRR